MNSHLSPRQRYQQELNKPEFKHDAAQSQAVDNLHDLYLRIIQKKHASSGLVSKFLKGIGVVSQSSPEKGLYLWGGVGRGKTFLMDIFFDALPIQDKMRTHFHRFMKMVHAELNKNKGQKNPLDIVAKSIAGRASVICFDEFFVVDITDAMMLSNLLQSLFKEGVTLVATSNIAPDGLYKDGLQRARFLPAIDLLKEHTCVLNVDGGVDYRLRALEQAALYYSPLNDESHQQMTAFFDRLAPDELQVEHDSLIEIEGRLIRAISEAEDVVWFDFKAICDGPRSQNDYIEVAREYHAVLVSGVPVLDSAKDDLARRFIYLVDEFYDRNVKLIVSAEVSIGELYKGLRLKFEFDRTISRVIEMQSHAYLARPHKP